MEHNKEIINPTVGFEKEIYTERAISIGAVLGGPLAAIYFIANNFNVFGKKQAAKKTWFIGLSISIIVFLIIFSLPENLWNSSATKLFQFLWAVPAYFVVRRYQQEDILQHLEMGVKKSSGWKIFGYSLWALFVTFLFLGVLTLIKPDQREGGSLLIDEMASVQMDYSGCRIYYDSLDVTNIDAKVIGSYLEEYGYFAPHNKDVDAIVSRSGNIFTITLSIEAEFINDNEVKDAFKTIIEDIHTLYKDRTYQIKLISIDSVGVYREIIIKL